MKVQCKKCKSTFDKKNKDVSRSPNHFCSRSCAASYNNRRRISKSNHCKCGTKIRKHSEYCRKCANKERANAIDNMTLKEASYSKNHSNKYSRIRDRAQTLYEKNKLPCQICNYSVHVEICHKRDISDWPEDTLVKVINDRSNIVFLCRNCHWEFDHHLLKL